ncbi:MAG: phage terminase large subunit [Halobacteriota archaeon]
MRTHGPRIRRLEAYRPRAKGATEIPSDPIAFALSLKIDPDPWQRDLLTATDKRIILNCSRQSGKSTIAAILALFHVLTNPNALVLILSPTQRQSGLLFEKIIEFYEKCGRPLYATHSVTVLKLKNRSRIISLPGSEGTVRGFSAPSLVLIDEAAQVPDDLYYAVVPMFAVSRGRLILLSTPNGKEGIFWRAWNDSGWKKVKVTAAECPRIAQEDLELERGMMGGARFAQEYCCEFVQPEASLFNEGWIKYYDPRHLPPMDIVIQSWDTALTKSATSDYVVGQVWGRLGDDCYLLDQVKGKFDFDETVAAIKILSATWDKSTAKIVEAQTLGAPLALHLKDQVEGVIAVHVRGSKEVRALNCVPLWQSGHVYIPRPDNSTFSWVNEYVHDLTTFPGAEHDDTVDATTLALNQLNGTLFPHVRSCVADAKKRAAPSPDKYYRIGWIPARHEGYGVIVVLDEDTNDVVSFERVVATTMEEQIAHVATISCRYNDACVRVREGLDDAEFNRLAYKGIPVTRVKFTSEKWTAAFENLSMLIANGRISYPNDPNLVAELQVFKSAYTFSETPDYTLQRGQDTAIRALCLVTHDLSAEEIDWMWGPVDWISGPPKGYDDIW